MSPSLSPWPSTITLMYGFRNLTLALPLSSDDGSSADYRVSPEVLEELGMLNENVLLSFLVYPSVSVTVTFPRSTHRRSRAPSFDDGGDDIATGTTTTTATVAATLHTAPFSICGARPPPFSPPPPPPPSSSSRSSSEVHVLDRSQRSQAHNVSFAADDAETALMSAKLLPEELLPSSPSLSPSPSSPTRFSERSSEMLSDDFSDSGTVNFSLRRCVLLMCSPCFSQLLCLWHVGRSTPTPSLAALALAVTSVLLGDYNLSLIIDSLSGCGLRVSASLYDAYRVAHALVLVIDCLMVLFSALLTGLTREIFCLCVYRTGVFDFDNILGGGGGGSGSFSSVGRSDDDAPQLSGGEGHGRRRRKNRSAACFCCAGCLRRCGGTLLVLAIILPCFCIGISGLVIHFATCAAFVARLANQACDDEEDDDDDQDGEGGSSGKMQVQTLFTLVNNAVPYTDFDEVDVDKFCNERVELLDNVLTMLVAAWVLLVAQSLFFSIMVDNRRVAQGEQATRAFELGAGEDDEVDEN